LRRGRCEPVHNRELSGALEGEHVVVDLAIALFVLFGMFVVVATIGLLWAHRR
jgi:hypothetical protein